jgi:drug/metabolite transporter (DMT)-like permease
MLVASIGVLCAILALLALAVAVASWLVSRRLRKRRAGPVTIIFFVLAGPAPLALLVYFWGVLHRPVLRW